MSLEINYISTDVLIPYVNNSRTHSDKQVTEIASSIKEFGFTNPVLIDKENTIIAGHGRLLASKKLGLKEVPTILLENLTEAQKKAYIIADNKLALNAGWDEELLSIELKELDELGYDTSLTGFSEDELSDILDKPITKGLTDEDEVPEDVEPIVEKGDIWQLGNHRLMCGNSCNDDVRILMNNKKSNMVFTDPPYNVSIGTIKHRKFKQREILNDSMSKNDFRVFCKDFCNNIKKYNEGIIYCWSGQGADGRIIFTTLDDFFHNSTTIIWKKDVFTLGRGKYQNQYEPCWFGWNKNGNSFTSDRKLVNVWDVKRPKRSDLHPTMKPVELVEMALTHSSKLYDIVLDLFGGSGTTIIACEKLQRTAYVMELDPKYCDVIIKRWENFTGKKAERIENGLSN